MKKYVLVAMFVLAGSFANAAFKPGSLNMKCTSQGKVGRFPISVELIQLDDISFREGDEVSFQLEVKDIRPAQHEVRVLSTFYKGIVTTEDVQVWFNSSDAAVNVGIYLDEMNESYIEFAGKKPVGLDCEYLETEQ